MSRKLFLVALTVAINLNVVGQVSDTTTTSGDSISRFKSFEQKVEGFFTPDTTTRLGRVERKVEDYFTLFGHKIEQAGIFHHHPDSISRHDNDKYKDSVVYHKYHFSHLRKHRSGLYEAKMENRDLRELLSDIMDASGYSFTYVGTVDVNVSLDIESFTIEHVIDEVAYQSGMLAVRDHGRYIFYGKGAKDIVKDKKIIYTYTPRYRDHEEVRSQISNLGIRARVYPVKTNNALLIEGTLDDIKDAIAKMRIVDFKPIRVSIELLVVEYNHGKQFDWGINITTGEAGRISNGTYNPGASMEFTYSFLGQLDPNFKANLTALVKNDYANILTNPHVVTTNNKKANIEIKESRYITLQRASVNGLTTNLQSISTGIKLDVTPIIMSNDNILMTVEGNSSDFLPAETSGTINTLTNMINTDVMVKNGETLIIGGLIEARESDGVSGLPILRHIPILNLLFRNNSNQKSYTETVIYITPYIDPLRSDILHQSARQYEKDAKRMKEEDKKLNRKGLKKLY